MITMTRFSSSDVTAQGRKFRHGIVLLLATCQVVAFFASCAWGAIPASERAVLVDLYNYTNGAGWTDNTNWNGAAGTECTWYGVTCNGIHVTTIYLRNNNLIGTLPSLTGLTNLQYFSVGFNHLAGPIPSLTGLTSLWYLDLEVNQLTGSIPTLAGLTSLQYFYANANRLTGPIPTLAGLASLNSLSVNNNRLTGTIPSLTGLTNLQYFSVTGNQLTGPIPSLTGLTSLRYIYLHYNYLSGDVPAVPNPNGLVSGYSALCPNYLNHTTNPAWDAATPKKPWYVDCTTAPVRILTGYSYPNIQMAYDNCADGNTIEAQKDSSADQDLVFDNPVSVKLIGGYDGTYTSNTGATLVNGCLIISHGKVEIANIVIK